MDKTKHILTLLNLPGIGRKSVYKILSISFSIPTNGYELIEEITHLKKIIKRLKIPSRNDIQKAGDKAQKILENSHNENISVISILDKRFPKKLADCPDPPVIINVKGDVHSLNKSPSIAIIGTREPTHYGAECGDRISRTIARQNISIISGLAKGCDSIAHQACLKENGVTIAILAHGLQMVYPAENKKLAAEIIEKGGCLLTEYPIVTKPRPNYFVERDRLQTALSDAVFFIETDLNGGTMHAVKACIAAGKPLACLKHPGKWLSEKKTEGNQALIRDESAIPIADSNDLEVFLTKKNLNDSITSKTAKPKQLDLFDNL